MVRRQDPARTVGYEYDALDQLVACDVDGAR
jgi:YD repeat-containing protein